MSALADIPGLLRVENTDRDDLVAKAMEMTHSVYPHDQVYGTYCTVQEFVDCPPDLAYEYLRKGHHLEEWTYSVRDFEPTGTEGLWVGEDKLEPGTPIYCRVESNDQARTVDFHCSWEKGDQLWMIYLMRVVDAKVVLDKPGSVIMWTNCRHPNYDDNPHPDKPWVGDFWDLFYAGHTIEMLNLKRILEFRHHNGFPVSVRPAR